MDTGKVAQEILKSLDIDVQCKKPDWPCKLCWLKPDCQPIFDKYKVVKDILDRHNAAR